MSNVAIGAALIAGGLALYQGQVERDRSQRHFCAAVELGVFASTADLHAYQAKNGCRVEGTVPDGGGPIVVPPKGGVTVAPGPTVTATSTATAAAPGGRETVRVPVPGPTVTRQVPGPTVTRTVQVPGPVVRLPGPTVTVRCAPGGLLGALPCALG